jgi:hypothetical protein
MEKMRVFTRPSLSGWHVTFQVVLGWAGLPGTGRGSLQKPGKRVSERWGLPKEGGLQTSLLLLSLRISSCKGGRPAFAGAASRRQVQGFSDSLSQSNLTLFFPLLLKVYAGRIANIAILGSRW